MIDNIKMLSLPKVLINKIKEYLNVEEELNWDNRRKYYKLKLEEPTLADMVKYNYFNYIKYTKESFYPELLFLVNNTKMLDLVLSKIGPEFPIYEVFTFYIINDNIDLFKRFYSTFDYSYKLDILHDSIEYNALTILKYIIEKFHIETLRDSFEYYGVYLKEETISTLEEYILMLGEPYDSLLPLSQIVSINYMKDFYSMVNKNVEPSLLVAKLNDKNVFKILDHLMSSKNSYFFRLFEYLMENNKELCLKVVPALYRIATENNDYVAIRRFSKINHKEKFLSRITI